jgi:hypothetical protein
MDITIISDRLPDHACDGRSWTIKIGDKVRGEIVQDKTDYGSWSNPTWLTQCYTVQFWNDAYDTVAKRDFWVYRTKHGKLVGRSAAKKLAAAKRWAKDRGAAL